jgi:hypothetical protein
LGREEGGGGRGIPAAARRVSPRRSSLPSSVRVWSGRPMEEGGVIV